MTVTIFHNPGCSKSRQTLGILRDREVELEVVEYLKAPPSKAQLDEILALLDREPRQLMRVKEPMYRELGLDDPDLDRDALIEAMIEHPILIERPLVLAGGRAAVGRPPEAVLEIL